MTRISCRPRAKRPNRALRQAGYTLIEVMLSVSVLIVGATGFTLLQGASARAVQNAQEHTVALQIMETWIERVRRDATLWTSPGQSTMENTKYLKATKAAWGTWITPETQGTSAEMVASAGANAWGWDQLSYDSARYCVKLRYQVAHWTQEGGPFVEDALRADVMVWRPRAGAAVPKDLLTSNGGTNCLARDSLLFGPGVFRAVTSILVRWQ